MSGEPGDDETAAFWDANDAAVADEGPPTIAPAWDAISALPRD